MSYELTPEALAFIAEQEPRHVTNRARYLAKSLDTAEEQLEALRIAVAWRKQNKALLWRRPEIVSLLNRGRARRREVAKSRSAESAATGRGLRVDAKEGV